MEIEPDTQSLQTGNGQMPTVTGDVVLRGGNGKKVRLVSRRSLDGRTAAAKKFDQLVSDVRDDLSGGGKVKLSAIQLKLIDAFASACITAESFNVELLQGKEIDVAKAAQASMVMVRIGARLGLQRIEPPRPPLHERLAKLNAEETR